MATHKTKEAALKAAHKALGNDAIEGMDFVLRNTGAGWTHEDVPPANDTAKKAQAKRVAKPKAPKAEKPPKATKAPAAPKAAKTPKPPKAKAEPKPKAEGPNKTEQLVAMMKKPGGATSKEMEEAVGWQPHSVRGLLGTLRGKGVKVVSTKNGKEPTYYTITSEAEAPAASVGEVL